MLLETEPTNTELSYSHCLFFCSLPRSVTTCSKSCLVEFLRHVLCEGAEPVKSLLHQHKRTETTIPFCICHVLCIHFLSTIYPILFTYVLELGSYVSLSIPSIPFPSLSVIIPQCHHITCHLHLPSQGTLRALRAWTPSSRSVTSNNATQNNLDL